MEKRMIAAQMMKNNDEEGFREMSRQHITEQRRLEQILSDAGIDIPDDDPDEDFDIDAGSDNGKSEATEENQDNPTEESEV